MADEATARQTDRSTEAVVAAHARRNFAMLAIDYGAFALGWTFASTSTILPAFAEMLGASNLLIGAIPAAMTVGYTLPPLFAANYTERLPRKLPLIIAWTALERVPLLFLGLLAYLLATRAPGLVLAAIMISLLSMSGAGGALMPAWMDLIAKVILPNRRGRLFALGSVIGSGLGVLGTVLSGYYLRTYAFPLNYSLCFATGFICLLASWVCLAMVVEPPVRSTKPHVGMATYLRQLPSVLKRDRSFAWYLVYRAIAILGGMASAFYAVFALRVLGAPVGMVASYTTVLLAGQALANLGFGSLADRVGHKAVIALGTLLAVAANAIALGARSPEWLYAVFVCYGASIAAGNVSLLNISVEFAPDEDRPTYVGLASTVATPLAVVASLLGGALADASGYPAVFVLSASVSLVALGVLLFRVRDPRGHPRPPRLAEQPE